MHAIFVCSTGLDTISACKGEGNPSPLLHGKINARNTCMPCGTPTLTTCHGCAAPSVYATCMHAVTRARLFEHAPSALI